VDRIPGGATLSVTIICLLALVFVAREVSKAVSKRFQGWLSPDLNLRLAVGVVLVGGLAVLYELWITLAAISVSFIAAFATRSMRRILKTRKQFIALAAMGIMIVGAAWYDIATRRSREQSFDVAFVLPSEAREDRELLYGHFKAALVRSFRGVERVRIVPLQLAKDDYDKYSYDNERNLLLYRTPEGHVRLFIRSQYTSSPTNNGQGRILKSTVTPYLRPATGPEGLQRIADWKPLTVTGHSLQLEAMALRNSFQFISVLLDRSIIELSSVDQARIWSNVLHEYQLVLTRLSAECAALMKLENALPQLNVRLAQPAGLHARDLKQIRNDVAEILATECPALEMGGELDLTRVRREVDTAVARIAPDAVK
jgi:hypothetical protein